MLDQSQVDQLEDILMVRYTAEELVEILNLSAEDIFYAFRDKIIDTDWSEIIE